MAAVSWKSMSDVTYRRPRLDSIFPRNVYFSWNVFVFPPNQNLLLFFLFFFQLVRGRWRGIGVQKISRGKQQSFREARCKLPFVYRKAQKARGLPLLMFVSISNNGILTGKRLKLMVYDSSCQRCLPNGVCYRKVRLTGSSGCFTSRNSNKNGNFHLKTNSSSQT